MAAETNSRWELWGAVAGVVLAIVAYNEWKGHLADKREAEVIQQTNLKGDAEALHAALGECSKRLDSHADFMKNTSKELRDTSVKVSALEVKVDNAVKFGEKNSDKLDILLRRDESPAPPHTTSPPASYKKTLIVKP